MSCHPPGCPRAFRVTRRDQGGVLPWAFPVFSVWWIWIWMLSPCLVLSCSNSVTSWCCACSRVTSLQNHLQSPTANIQPCEGSRVSSSESGQQVDLAPLCKAFWETPAGEVGLSCYPVSWWTVCGEARPLGCATEAACTTFLGLEGPQNILGSSYCSVAQLCPTLCDPMDCSTPGLPVHHQLPEFTQTQGTV